MNLILGIIKKIIMRIVIWCLLAIVLTACGQGSDNSTSQSLISLPPQADSAIQLTISDISIEKPEVGKICQGTFTVTNIGPDYVWSPTEIGPNYGVFIYDAIDTMLFRNFGSWSYNNKHGDSAKFSWNTNSNHLGEASEPAFLIPKPGVYKLVIVIYPGARDTMLCYSMQQFSVGLD